MFWTDRGKKGRWNDGGTVHLSKNDSQDEPRAVRSRKAGLGSKLLQFRERRRRDDETCTASMVPLNPPPMIKMSKCGLFTGEVFMPQCLVL
jgi:hypothetical protein